MTDEQIVMALKYCASSVVNECRDCPFFKQCVNDEHLVKYALDLINRKDAEIERLNNELTSADEVIGYREAEIERLKEENKKQKMILEEINNEINPLPFVTDFDVAIKQAKSEAYKEFEGRALDEAKFYRVDKGYQGYLVWIDDILKIKKELTRNLHGTCTEGGNEDG